LPRRGATRGRRCRDVAGDKTVAQPGNGNEGQQRADRETGQTERQAAQDHEPPERLRPRADRGADRVLAPSRCHEVALGAVEAERREQHDQRRRGDRQESAGTVGGDDLHAGFAERAGTVDCHLDRAIGRETLQLLQQLCRRQRALDQHVGVEEGIGVAGDEGDRLGILRGMTEGDVLHDPDHLGAPADTE
jgi:hypothetical protein